MCINRINLGMIYKTNMSLLLNSKHRLVFAFYNLNVDSKSYQKNQKTSFARVREEKISKGKEKSKKSYQDFYVHPF